jgi:uncharacterized membrane protein (TIGR02234 family)
MTGAPGRPPVPVRPGDRPGGGSGGRRRVGSRLLAILVVLFGAGLVVLAAGRPWARATIVGLPGPDVVTADGRSAAPGAPALGLVAVAGAIVLATSGRLVRTVVAGLLVLAGAGIGLVGAGVFEDPAAALAPAVAKATGMTGGSTAFTGKVTVWPVLSGAGGVLVALGGLIALVRGRRWSGPSTRFERAGAGGTSGGATADDAREGEVTTFASGTKVTGRLSLGEGKPVRSSKDQCVETWDRLSAGEDPTD